jgi:hypothetical protein
MTTTWKAELCDEEAEVVDHARADEQPEDREELALL